MNKDTRGTTVRLVKIGLKETYLLACQFYFTYASCIFMGKVRAELDRGAILYIIFKMCSIFTSIQIFSLIHCYHLSTTPAPIFSWAYFNTPAILFNTSDSVAKVIIKKKKKLSETKCNCRRRLQLFYSRRSCSVPTIFFLINHTRKLFWHSNLNEPQTKNFVLIIIHLSEVEIQQSSDFFLIIVIQMSNLFIQVTIFKITITNLNSKFCIHYFKSWYFLKNSVSNFL